MKMSFWAPGFLINYINDIYRAFRRQPRGLPAHLRGIHRDSHHSLHLFTHSPNTVYTPGPHPDTAATTFIAFFFFKEQGQRIIEAGRKGSYKAEWQRCQGEHLSGSCSGSCCWGGPCTGRVWPPSMHSPFKCCVPPWAPVLFSTHLPPISYVVVSTAIMNSKRASPVQIRLCSPTRCRGHRKCHVSPMRSWFCPRAWDSGSTVPSYPSRNWDVLPACLPPSASAATQHRRLLPSSPPSLSSLHFTQPHPQAPRFTSSTFWAGAWPPHLLPRLPARSFPSFQLSSLFAFCPVAYTCQSLWGLDIYTHQENTCTITKVLDIPRNPVRG